eukprot:GFKZ01003402.1.p2 GENE.GFKZ01003402.1~~GFKZ01003402.1.p2  ORF type:complete len:116 (+),score=15.88 GFKZ01003402.1:944-1291(+)
MPDLNIWGRRRQLDKGRRVAGVGHVQEATEQWYLGGKQVEHLEAGELDECIVCIKREEHVAILMTFAVDILRDPVNDGVKAEVYANSELHGSKVVWSTFQLMMPEAFVTRRSRAV